ncbi:MAG: hypothetical protein IRZ06_12215 [Nevskia sp.]|nr:hypothetical protein [Nevskia sp.]
MKIWIVADDEGTEVEAASLEEAVEEYVRSWWLGHHVDRPGRWATIVAREIIDQCPECGEPLTERDETVPGSYVYHCPVCDAESQARYLNGVYRVPEPARVS